MLLWMVLLFFSTLNLQSQDYFFDKWEVKDGLPQNSVNQILQTSNGYLWVATEGGLGRFDGLKFKTFNSQNVAPFSSNRIGVLQENANGDLLIGSYKSGLVIYRNGDFFKPDLPFVGGNSSVREITPDGFGRLWLAFSEIDTLIALNADTYEIIPTNAALLRRPTHSIFNNEKHLFFIGGKELDIRDSLMRKATDVESPTWNSDIQSILSHPDGDAHWIMENDILHKLNKTNFLISGTYPIPDEYNSDSTISVFEKAGGKIYISYFNSSEVIIFDAKTESFNLLKLDEICENGTIQHVYSDREENIWLATNICGLLKLKPPRFTYLNVDGEPFDKTTYAIFRDSLNRIIVGTRQDDIHIFDENLNFIEKPEYLKINGSFITSIEENNGVLFYSAVGRPHLNKWKGKEESFVYFDQQRQEQVISLFEDSNNELWMSTALGIYRYERDSLHLAPNLKGENTKGVVSFAEDEKGVLWMVGEQGLMGYELRTEKVIYESSNRESGNRFFRGLYVDNDGLVFTGSYGFGLSVLRDDSLYRLTQAQGLPENVVSSITEDESGNIWLTGNKGMTRLKKEALLNYLNGDVEKINTVLYNEQTDGLLSGEFNGGFQQVKCHLGGERYIFASLKGAVVADFANMSFNEAVPPVHIQELSYSDTLIAANGDEVRLPYADSRMEISFTALSFVSPQNVRFKFMLEGYDKNWIEAGADRKTAYSKIPPGDYIFRVLACNNEGVWNETGDSIALSIVPPFFMTWWFRSGVLILSVLLSIFAVYKAVAASRKRERQKSAMMDILPDLVFKLDRDGKYLDLYGRPANFPVPTEEIDQKRIADFLPGGVSEEAKEKVRRAIETNEMQEYTYNVGQNNGEKRYYESRFISIDAREVLCIIRDITESTRAQTKIRKGEEKLLTALETEKKLLKRITEQQKLQLEAIVNTEEKERERIAKDLHDGIGQLLSSVKINLGVASEIIVNTPAAEKLLSQSKATVDQITRELRNISYNLLPPSLEQFGLASAMEEEVNRLKGNPDLFIHFDSSIRDQKFSKKLEVVLFRVFQEVLNNAVKHAKAKEITIQLIQHPHHIMLMIEDDGVGFNPEEALIRKDSSGLKNLNSRIDLLQGSINIDSDSNAGTSITIEIPL
ncbi:MAG: two-component regulator propeller domain-containing protein [Cryomorphaceae bacterium]